MTSKRETRRYQGYVQFGKGHDVVKLPLETLPNCFHRWMQRIFFGFIFVNSDGKEIN